MVRNLSEMLLDSRDSQSVAEKDKSIVVREQVSIYEVL